MKTKILFPLLALALAACTGSAAPSGPAATQPPIPTAAEVSTDIFPVMTEALEQAADTPLPATEALATESAPQETAPPALYDGIPQGITVGGYHSLGDPDAPLTLVDYSDFLWTTCRRYVLAVEPEIIEQYVRPGQVKLVFRAVLNFGERSERAAEAAACAGQQGQFWQMHKLLFENQDQVSSASGEGLVDLLLEYASGLEGLNQESFQQCLEERSTLEKLKAVDQEQRSRGIFYQPVFEVGDQRLAGFQDFTTMGEVIEAELQAVKWWNFKQLRLPSVQ